MIPLDLSKQKEKKKMTTKEKFPVSAEDSFLKAKFRSLAFTSPHRDQRRSEVEPQKAKVMEERSYELWKKLNPGYFYEQPTTTTRDAQKYESDDFKINDKSHNRQRDRHTDFVNFVVRDQVLSRKR